MTIFEYLGIKDETHLLTDDYYITANAMFHRKTSKPYKDLNSKLLDRDKSLSEQLQLPIVLIDEKIPAGENVSHLIIKHNNKLLYCEDIVERSQVFQPINGEVVNIRGLYLSWGRVQKFGNTVGITIKGKTNLLYPFTFNTIDPDGNLYDIRTKGNNTKL